MRLSTQIQDNARSHTNSTHTLFSPSPVEKRSSTRLLCYSCQYLVFTQPQTNYAHFTRTKLVKQSYRQPGWRSSFDISPTLSSPPLASTCVKGLVTGSLRHVRSRTPVSTELYSVTLYSPSGPRINFTEDSGSAGVQTPGQTCQASKWMCHCYFSFISLEVRISGSNWSHIQLWACLWSQEFKKASLSKEHLLSFPNPTVTDVLQTLPDSVVS